MQLYKKLIFTFLAIIFVINLSYASHYMGGEITWVCRSNGKYDFYLKLYRECNGITYNNTETLNTTVPGVPSITMTMISAQEIDMSPKCYSNDPTISIHCSPQPTTPNTGAVSLWYYSSLAAYPTGVTLNGVPPASGWVFSHTSCCRNPCTNIVSADSKSWYLRAIMYPYQNRNANPCYDNSPVFKEDPSTVITAGYPFAYNHNASDAELDSLHYSWAPPLDGSISSPITSYAPGYSYQSPLPGPSHNSNNIPAQMNPITGEITFLSYTQGAFVTVTKVTAYKCGIKVAEIFREMQVVMLADPNNNLPPEVSKPFSSQNNGVYDSYIDTVYAGKVVTFTINGYDPGFLPNSAIRQTMKITASGGQFGTNFVNSATGCPTPPCAVLNPPPPVSGQLNVMSSFTWQTTCDHLSSQVGCNRSTNVYTFLIKVQDNMCPAPAINYSTVTVVVVPPPPLKPPTLRSTRVLPNGNVVLGWIPVIDTLNSFYDYQIFRSNNVNGPYTLVDSISNIMQNTYTVTGTLANSQPVYFYMRTRSGCGNTNQVVGKNSDTLATIHLKAFNNGNRTTNLTWNKIHNPHLSNFNGYYRIYRSMPAGSPYVKIDSTTALTYLDNKSECSDGPIDYYIETQDDYGFICLSNIDVDIFNDNNAYVKPPSLRCISVNNDGSIDLSWVKPIDTTGTFKKYVIYASTSRSGPYTMLDSSITDINTTTYHHAITDGNTQQYYYYIRSKSGCPTHGAFYPITSDTLNQMMVNLLNGGTGVAQLEWNTLKSPPPVTQFGKYVVMQEFPAGTWNIIDSTSSLSYNDTITLCYANVAYKVYIRDSSGCTSYSAFDRDIFGDITPPVTPVIDSVSVDWVANIVNLGWTTNTTSDIEGFVVYKLNNGIWDSLVSIPMTTANVLFSDLNVNTASESEQYCIAAYDSCGNISPMSAGHKTILLKYILDRCNSSMKLTWSDYQNMGATFTYRVYYNVNNGPYQLLIEVPSHTLEFTHQGLSPNTFYSYYVQAVALNGVKSSTSNLVSIFANVPKSPDFLTIRSATVVNNEYVKVRLAYDTTAYITQIKLFRSETPDGPFSEVGVVENIPDDIIEFEDHSALFKLKSYYYKMTAYDSCMGEIILPDMQLARTIYLTGEAKYEMINELNWNNYEGWPGGVQGYRIYRKVDGVLDQSTVLVTPTLTGQNVYRDDVSNYSSSSGKFSYYVEAVESLISTQFFREYAYSNEVFITQMPRLFVPNAFAPRGYNTIFKPINVFIAPDKYHLTIFNRFGSVIFESNNYEIGWDGTYKGSAVPQGVYAYLIKYADHQGNYYEKAGTITVLP